MGELWRDGGAGVRTYIRIPKAENPDSWEARRMAANYSARLEIFFIPRGAGFIARIGSHKVAVISQIVGSEDAIRAIAKLLPWSRRSGAAVLRIS